MKRFSLVLKEKLKEK